MTNEEFFRLADRFGHDCESLARGLCIQSEFRLDSPLAARGILSHAGAEARRVRGLTFFDEIRARQRFPQGYHDRGEAAAFADAELHGPDAIALARHPIRTRALSARRIVVPAGMVWDLSEAENTYVAVNVGELVLEQGARVEIRSNVLGLLCQRIVCEGLPRPAFAPDAWELPAYHLGVFASEVSGGLAGAVGGVGIDGRGPERAPARHLFGGSLTVGTRGDGEPGGRGGPGGPGTRGYGGALSKIAEITFRSVVCDAGVLVVCARGGTGGTGGAGGEGGAGGKGGAHDAVGIEGQKGSRCGAGGPGGQGGHGGAGGNGGPSSNVYVVVPDVDVARVALAPMPSAPGLGGPGGEGGRGGAGTPDGANGAQGMSGRRGNKGRRAPAMYLNEVRQPALVPLTVVAPAVP